MKNGRWTMIPLLYFLASCATTPWAIPENHPANPSAKPSRGEITSARLADDADTRLTQTLLQNREKQAGNADAESLSRIKSPASSTPASEMDHMTLPMGQ
jgi:hypothetical protein